LFSLTLLLGGEEAFREMVDACHARNMRVVLDGGVFQSAQSLCTWKSAYRLPVGRSEAVTRAVHYTVDDVASSSTHIDICIYIVLVLATLCSVLVLAKTLYIVLVLATSSNTHFYRQLPRHPPHGVPVFATPSNTHRYTMWWMTWRATPVAGGSTIRSL